MKRTPLKRKTPLRAKPKTPIHLDYECTGKEYQKYLASRFKRKPLNRLSPAKVRQLNSEVPIRITLCERAKGKPEVSQKTVTISGQKYTYAKVVCLDGICESCGKRSNLEPHERIHRSQGGRVSLQNSIMVCRQCHIKLQGSSPMWSKNNPDL